MRLGDLDALADELIKRGFYPVIVRRSIETAQTVDAVEVVRCKDCTAFRAESSICSDTGYEVSDDDFCSFGERRNDESKKETRCD